MKNDKGFDIRVDVRENGILVNDMRKWLLSRKMIDRILWIEFYQQFQSVNYVKNILLNGIKFIC